MSLVGWHFVFWVSLAFGPQNPDLKDWRIFEFVFDSLYFLDVILKFFTGIPNLETTKVQNVTNGDLDDTSEPDIGYVHNRRTIAKYYLKTTFFVDIIALVPYFMYFIFEFYGKEIDSMTYLYYLKVVRLLFNRSLNNSIDLLLGEKNLME